MNRASDTRAASGALARSARELSAHAAEAASLLRALANEQRLMILCNLVSGPLTVGDLNARVPLSQSALSQHLAVLRESGIVRTERQAQSVRYSLPPGLVTRLLGILHEEYCAVGSQGRQQRP
ncbi:MAG: metalloregulator ArsR/SmtB family transcription factor [Steroidobacteraceae bacterium]